MMTGMLKAATIDKIRKRAQRKASKRPKMMKLKMISLEMKQYVSGGKRRMRGHSTLNVTGVMEF